jgi:hypothetical protein
MGNSNCAALGMTGWEGETQIPFGDDRKKSKCKY